MRPLTQNTQIQVTNNTQRKFVYSVVYIHVKGHISLTLSPHSSMKHSMHPIYVYTKGYQTFLYFTFTVPLYKSSFLSCPTIALLEMTDTGARSNIKKMTWHNITQSGTTIYHVHMDEENRVTNTAKSLSRHTVIDIYSSPYKDIKRARAQQEPSVS